VTNARPGYWDMDRCSWVGVEPMYVMPPVRHADHPHDRVVGAPLPQVPAPRHRRPEAVEDLDLAQDDGDVAAEPV
jgi:hypothetical protein